MSARTKAGTAAVVAMVVGLGLWAAVLVTMRPAVAPAYTRPQSPPTPTSTPGPAVPSRSSIGTAWSWTEGDR